MASAPSSSTSRDVILPKVIGHRGAMSYAPENTLASIRKAAELGARWVEVDVALTSDGVPVIFHDPTLLRTTGYAGDLARTPYAELQKLDAGKHFHRDFTGERVPSLTALIACLSELEMGMNLEIKPTPGTEVATTRIACDLLDRLWPDHLPLPLLSSFQRPCLREAKRHAPHYPRGLLDGPLTDHWRDEVAEFDCRSIHLWTQKIDQADVATVKDSNTLLAVYTVNEGPRAKELLDWGADSIITDAPDVVFSVL
ncbi:glycerophosphodiester phosphodiesterase family protein [Rhodovibrionaceae bacterium A322]